MDCRDALELVEAIAAGDLEPDASLRAHVESCTRCAAALASARRLEAALAAREAPAAPARFTPVVLQRIRRDRWRAEQQVDRLFNVAIVAAIVLVLGGLLAMMNVDTVIAFTASTWQPIKDGARDALRDAIPTMGTYVAALGLLLCAVGMWWWAEHRLQF
jgi:anti-sigma factor RsiW